MKQFSLSIFYLLCSMFLFASPVMAKVIIQEKGIITIPAGEIINDDLFIAGESVNINGTVIGDIFVGAGSVRVSGDIRGGLFIGTGDLSLSGAKIGNSLIAGAGNVTIDQESQIGGSLIVGAGNLKNYGSVSRNVMAGAGTVLLNGQVGKEVRVGAGVLELGPKSAIVGNLTYSLSQADNELNKDSSSTITGTVTRYTPPVDAKRNFEQAKLDINRFGRMANKGWLIVTFLGSLLVGFVILRLFPKTSLELSSEISKSLWSSLGVGFIIIIAIVPLLLVLALTIVGLPMAGLLFLLFCLELHLAKLIASYALGRFIALQFNWNKMGAYAVYAIGLTIFFFLRAIPGAGWVVSFLFAWTGLGAIWLYTKTNLKNL